MPTARRKTIKSTPRMAAKSEHLMLAFRNDGTPVVKRMMYDPKTGSLKSMPINTEAIIKRAEASQAAKLQALHAAIKNVAS